MNFLLFSRTLVSILNLLWWPFLDVSTMDFVFTAVGFELICDLFLVTMDFRK